MKPFANLLIVIVLFAPAVHAADTPSATNCFSDTIRISALVNNGGQVKVGIIELANSNSYFAAAGETAGEIEITAIDYDKEQVTLRRGDTTCVLNLAADPNAPKATPWINPPDSPLYRGEAIERFLKENPNAVEQGLIKFPLAVSPPAEGRGETIEKFLRENPEAARIANTPVVGKGEGIEKFLREHPEARVEDTPIPEGSLGPGIEAAMKDNPQIISNGITPTAPQPSPTPPRQ